MIQSVGWSQNEWPALTLYCIPSLMNISPKLRFYDNEGTSRGFSMTAASMSQLSILEPISGSISKISEKHNNHTVAKVLNTTL